MNFSGTFTKDTESNKNDTDSMNDEVLLSGIKNGDPRSFENLVLKYEKSVYNLCFRFFSCEEDAMDATQEVFIKVYKSIDRFEGRSSLKTWIYRIASNTCITISQQQKKAREGLLQTIMNYWQKVTYNTPEDELIKNETTLINQKLVSEKISTLPETYRIPLILKDIEDLPLNKIAEILDIPQGTVKSRLNRGRKMLHDKLVSLISC